MTRHPQPRHRHTRAQVREARARRRAQVAERLRWRGETVPPVPYHWAAPADWWPALLHRVHTRDRHPCSCLFCGNARRHSGPPMQERRLALRDLADLQ